MGKMAVLCFAAKNICHILQRNMRLIIAKFLAKCNSEGKKKLISTFLLKNVDNNFAMTDMINMDSCCIIDDK